MGEENSYTETAVSNRSSVWVSALQPSKSCFSYQKHASVELLLFVPEMALSSCPVRALGPGITEKDRHVVWMQARTIWEHRHSLTIVAHGVR